MIFFFRNTKQNGIISYLYIVGLREIYRSDDRFLYQSYEQLYRSFEKLYSSAESVYHPDVIREPPAYANYPEVVPENPNC